MSGTLRLSRHPLRSTKKAAAAAVVLTDIAFPLFGRAMICRGATQLEFPRCLP